MKGRYGSEAGEWNGMSKRNEAKPNEGEWNGMNGVAEMRNLNECCFAAQVLR